MSGRAERALDERLSRFAARLERAPTDELRTFAVRPLDAAAHDAARDRALGLAASAGRTARVAEAQARLASWLLDVLGARMYDVSVLGVTGRMESLRPEDRVHLAGALGDAALAIIVEDLGLDEADQDELLGPFASLVD